MPKIDVVLCIDDSPPRYNQLMKSLWQRNIVTIVCCTLEEVNFYLDGPYNILGVCLDHDMPVVGTYFARHIIPDCYPLAITSVNTVGADNIIAILEEINYQSRFKKIPGVGSWSNDALKFFNIP